MIPAGSLQRKFVGETEQLVRAIFKAAESVAPAVICIDEIESIIPKRFDQTTTNGFHINAGVNQLLTLLVEEREGVVIIGTTNHIESLDSAAIRPGRFDRKIALSLPNQSIREQILEIQLRGISQGKIKVVVDDQWCSIFFHGPLSDFERRSIKKKMNALEIVTLVLGEGHELYTYHNCAQKEGCSLKRSSYALQIERYTKESFLFSKTRSGSNP